MATGDEGRGGEKFAEILPDYFPRSRTRGFSFEGCYFRDSWNLKKERRGRNASVSSNANDARTRARKTIAYTCQN